MKPAYYMKFIEGDGSTPDRIGGLPNERPANVPCCLTCGSELAFLAQFYTNEHLDLAGWRGVHLYQCPNVDEGCDPYPVLTLLEDRYNANITEAGLLARGVQQFGIKGEYVEDPDEIPLPPGFGGDDQVLYQSKAGGVMPFIEAVPSQAECILQLTERPADLNFGGLRVGICKSGNSLSVVLL